METKQVPVDILVLNFNGLEMTKKLLASLYENTEYPFNLIIIDNASKDGSPEFLTAFGKSKPNVLVRLRTEPDGGFAEGINLGLKFAKSPYVLLLNNDIIIPEKGWLKKLVSILEKDSKIAIVGCKLLYPNDTIQFAGYSMLGDFIQGEWERLRIFDHTGRHFPRSYFSKTREVGAITYALALVRKDIFGVLDEEYKVGTYEDVDKCCELRSKGFKHIYCGEVELYHTESATQNTRKEELGKAMFRNGQRFLKRWGGWLLGDYNHNPSLWQATDENRTVDKNPLDLKFRTKYANPELRQIESHIIKLAYTLYNTIPTYREKGLKWCYNFANFSTLWCSSDRQIMDMFFRVAPYPEYIEVEPTTRCPLKCRMCEHTYWSEPEKDMTMDEFVHIVEEFPDLKYCGVTGLGDSLLNKDFFKMLKYCQEKDFVVECYDSMLLMNKENAKKLIESGVYRLFISMDAAFKHTYEGKVRPLSNWDTVIKNIKTLDSLKKEMNSAFPLVRFHFMVFKDNVDEVLTYLDLLKSLDIEIEGVQYSGLMHVFDQIKDQFIEIPDSLIEESVRKGKELDIRVSWNKYPPGYRRPCLAWTMPFIFVTGDVCPCCGSNQQNMRDYQAGAGSLGNIFKRPFKVIWNGEKYSQLRRLLKDDCVPTQCRNCFVERVN